MYLYHNYYSRDCLKRLRYYVNNTRVTNIVKECEQIDSISDYHLFKKYIVNNVKNRPISNFLMRSEFGAEGLRYGHRKAFFDYAGIITDEQRFIFPYFEHSVDLKERPVFLDGNREIHSLVLQAPYKNEMIHRVRPLIPVYNIGPYILYADQYFEENTYLRMKEQNRRTALLFPAHTYEGAQVSFDEKKFVNDVMDKFKGLYDTILVSVYWNDVDNPMYDMFEAAGAKLVSAGFREDPNFIVRLRAIIELADIVASNLTGSYIGYSMALEKPFYMFSEKATLLDAAHTGSDEEEKRYALTTENIFDAFSSLSPSEDQIKCQNSIYEKFWGGRKYFKSRDEAKSMILLSSKLLRLSKGTTAGYEKAIIDALRGDNKANLSEEERELLEKAIGANVKIGEGV